MFTTLSRQSAPPGEPIADPIEGISGAGGTLETAGNMLEPTGDSLTLAGVRLERG